MKLSAEEARRRLDSGKNLVNSLASTNGKNKVEFIPAKKDGNKLAPPWRAIPIATRVAAGVRSHFESQDAVAEDLEISQDTVSRYKRGVTGGEELQERIDAGLNAVRDTALTKLMSTLGLLDGEKLAEQDARGLANVASNLSKVIKDSIPEVRGVTGDTKVQVVIYSPQQREENKFNVVDV